MVTKYLRAVYASLLLTTGCNLWDFSDCRSSEIGECILYGWPDRVQERLELRASLVYQLENPLWRAKEAFGCGDGIEKCVV